LVRSNQSQLNQLKSVIDGLAATLGPNYEFVIHDFSDPAHSLIHIAGNVTNRVVGAPLTDRLLKAYRENGDKSSDILNLHSVTSDGSPIRSSSFFIRDSRGKVVGSLGMNINVFEYQFAQKVLERLCSGEIGDKPAHTDDVLFPDSVADMVSKIVDETFKNNPKMIGLMDKEERLSLIRELEQKGVFLMKGAVEEVSARLGLSRFSIYKYLKECAQETDRTKAKML
jgi:predicted transcriptional regulator YheO